MEGAHMADVDDLTHGEIKRWLERLESAVKELTNRVRRLEILVALAAGAGTLVGSTIGRWLGG